MYVNVLYSVIPEIQVLLTNHYLVDLKQNTKKEKQ